MVSIDINSIFLLCNIMSQVVYSSFDNWPNPKNNHFALAEATASITRKFFSISTNTVVIKERNLDSTMDALNRRILEHILTNLQETIAVQLYNGQTENQPWDYYIFIVDSAEAFDEIRWNFPRTFYERDFRFLIVLTKFTPEYFLVLNRIFTSCRRFHVINANVILQHPSLGVCMFKYGIFTKEKCHQVQPYLFFRFKDDVNTLSAVFPQKLLNFYGCPLRITARTNPPFLCFSGNKSNPVYEKDWQNLGGIDGELIRLLSKHLNFTINLLPFPKGRSYFINYTGFGCFAELREGRADIAIGGFSSSDPKRMVLTTSDTYRISPVLFIVRGGREVDPLIRLVTPFKRKLWLFLIVLLIIGAIMIRSLQHTSLIVQNFVFGSKITNPMTNFILVFLGYPMNRLPLRNFARYLLLLWLLMSLILRNAYQGSLFDSFRNDKFTRIPGGYNDLMKWNYKIIVSKYFQDTETFPKNRTITFDNGHIYRLKYLEKKRGRYATVALRDSFMSYLQDNYRNGSRLIMVNEMVYLHSASMFFPKHSMYAKVISRYLRLFSDAGINQYFGVKNTKDKIIFRSDKKGDGSLEGLSVLRLWGIFEICGWLLLIAAVIFLLELLSIYWRKLRTFLNIIS